MVFSILCFQVENPEGLFYKLSVPSYVWYLMRVAVSSLEF